LDFLAWDDESYVLKNQRIQQFDWQQVWWYLTHFSISNWHPLTMYSHALDYHLFGLQAWGHHLVNLLFHAANSIWVYVLTWTLLTYTQFSFNKVAVAGLTALMFALHPATRGIGGVGIGT